MLHMTPSARLTSGLDTAVALPPPTLPEHGHPPTRDATRSPNAITGISFVLPCFNEAENIAGAIRAASAAGARCATAYEIIVVDDGSRDETAAIVAGIVEADRHVRLVVHAHNRGYGDAVRSGMEAATMDWVFLTDADLQFDLGELEGFLPYTTRADVVAGWRILRQDRLHRRINAAAWNWLVRRAFHLPVRDVDCAFKLMRRELAQGCGLTCSGAMISTELLVKALAGGAKLEEIGVHHHPRVAGESSGAQPRVVLKAFRELVTLRRALPGRSAVAAG
ncbi:MAG: glycosyltransferase family 2 protein [Solirubrobacterales bacterium]|nr:glycosyltransferase family 2 protein [Solirubrobacterales bacterium]